jgi:type IV pilus assembly protein PilV
MEVLITLFVLLVGLLGIGALQSQAQIAELEAYQRAQALIVLSDIVDRINTNRKTVSCFNITNASTGVPYLGVGSTFAPACAASTSAYNTLADAAINALDDMLKGDLEKLGGVSVGSMIGARACISYDATTELGGVAGTGLYTVAVSWQGRSSLNVPTVNCGNDLYGPEAQRRTVSTTLRIANLYG